MESWRRKSGLRFFLNQIGHNTRNFRQEVRSLGVSLAKELTFEPMVGFWSVIGQNGVVFETLLIGHVPSLLATLYEVLRRNMTNFCQEAWSLGVSLAKDLTFELMVGFWSVIGQNGVVFETLLIGHVPSLLATLYEVLRRNMTNFCQEAWSLGVSLAKELTFEPMVGFWSVICQNWVVFEALLIGHVPSCLATFYDV